MPLGPLDVGQLLLRIGLQQPLVAAQRLPLGERLFEKLEIRFGSLELIDPRSTPLGETQYVPCRVEPGRR